MFSCRAFVAVLLLSTATSVPMEPKAKRFWWGFFSGTSSECQGPTNALNKLSKSANFIKDYFSDEPPSPEDVTTQLQNFIPDIGTVCTFFRDSSDCLKSLNPSSNSYDKDFKKALDESTSSFQAVTIAIKNLEFQSPTASDCNAFSNEIEKFQKALDTECGADLGQPIGNGKQFDFTSNVESLRGILSNLGIKCNPTDGD